MNLRCARAVEALDRLGRGRPAWLGSESGMSLFRLSEGMAEKGVCCGVTRKAEEMDFDMRRARQRLHGRGDAKSGNAGYARASEQVFSMDVRGR